MFDWQIMGGWNKAAQDCMEGWKKFGTSFTDTRSTSASSPFDTLKHMNRMANRNIRIYGAWLSYLDDVSKSGFKVGEGYVTGKKVKSDMLLKDLRGAYDKFTENVISNLEGTAIEGGVRGTDQVVKKSMDTFAGAESMALECLNTCTAAVRSANKLCRDMSSPLRLARADDFDVKEMPPAASETPEPEHTEVAERKAA